MVLSCHTFLHDPATPWWGIVFLVLSNAPFAWLGYVAYRYRFYFQAALAWGVFVKSSLYHLCKPTNGVCLLPYPILYNFDFFFALMNLPVVVHYFLPYYSPIAYWHSLPEKGRRATTTKELRFFTGFLGKETVMFVFYGVLIVLIINMGWINWIGYGLLLILVVLEALIVVVVTRIRFHVWPFFRWPYFITGFTLLTLGAISYISQDSFPSANYVYIYSVLHSLWHIVSAVGQYFLIKARLYAPPADILEELRKADVDLEHVDQQSVADITYKLYSNPEEVRRRLLLRQNQRNSPYTIYDNDIFIDPV